MKFKNYFIALFLILFFSNIVFSQNNEEDKSFYSTTWYLYKDKLYKKAPRANDVIEVKTWEGSISQDTTWNTDKIITGDVTIEAPNTLTIKPGVTIYFPKIDEDSDGVGDTDFIVEGRLNCQGLPNKKVIFTSYHDTKNNKDWAGIDFQSSSGQLSTISNAEILYAYKAVNIKSQDVTFNSCRIAYANQYALTMEDMISTNFVVIRNSTIEACGSYGLKINNGKINISNTIIKENSSYGLNIEKGNIVINDSIIEKNHTYGLTMESGNLSISNLSIISNSGDGIILKPGVIVEANELVVLKNYKGLHINEIQDAKFINCNFSQNSHFGILIENSDASFNNCIINTNGYSGVKVQKKYSDITFKHCSVNNNQKAGFYVEDQTSGNVTYSTITGNKGFGVKIAATSNPAFNFNHIYGNGGAENTVDRTQYFDDDDWLTTGSKNHPGGIITAKRYIKHFYYSKDGDEFNQSGRFYYYNYSQILYKNNVIQQDNHLHYASNSYNMSLLNLSYDLNTYITSESDIQIKIATNSNCPNARIWVKYYTYNYIAPSNHQVAAIVTPETKINFKNNYWKPEATNSTIKSLIYSENDNINYDNHSWDPIPNVGSTLSVHASKDVAGIANSEVKVPIKIINYTEDLNVISFQFTIDYDSEILSAKGVLKENTLTEDWEIYTDVSDGKKISVRGININPLKYGKDILIYLLFDVNENVEVGEISSFVFTEFKVNSDIEDIVKENGRFQVIKEVYKVSGDVLYFNNDNPIPQTVMTIDGGENPVQIYSNQNGEYIFSDLIEGNYIVAPSNDAVVSNMIITPYDASIAARYALNMIELNQYQRLAANVDDDDKITVFDASIIAKYSAGLIDNFYKGKWLFDPPSMAYTLDRNMETQYKGIVVGDVSGNWQSKKDNYELPPSNFNVSIPDIAEVSSGDEILIPVNTDNLSGSNVYAYYAEIEYNPEVIIITNISKTNTISATWPNPALYTDTNGLIRIAAFGTEPLKGAGALINLKCQIKGNDDEITQLNFKQFAFNEGTPKVNILDGSVLIGKNPLSVSPEKIEIQKTAGQVSLDIITGDESMNWLVSCNESWLTITGDNKGIGSGKIIVNYLDNPGTARSGSITISSSEAANGPQTVDIYQFGMYQLQIKDISADPGEQIQIPITMNNPEGEAIEGIYIILEYNPVILDLIELSLAGSIIENANANIEQNVDIDGQIMLGIYFNENNFTSAGKLATLNFNVKGVQGDTTALKFIRAMINEKHASADDGLFIIGYKVSGYIGYYDVYARAVPDTSLFIDNFKATSNDYGNYYYNNLPPDGYYKSIPFKNTDLGGLTANDASLILRYTVNKVIFDCNEKFAADVTKDGNITPTDAAKVAKFAARYAAGQQDVCLNDDCIHWIFTTELIESCENNNSIFYQSKREYSPLESNLEEENFYGFRLGDVNGSWISDSSMRNNNARKLARSIDQSEIIPEIIVKPGENFSLPVVLNEEKNINSILITLSFDSDVVTSQGGNIENGVLSEYSYQEETNIRNVAAFVIYGSNEVQASGKLIDLNFVGIGKKQSTILELTRLECNDLQASGGFLFNTITTKKIKLIIDFPEPEIFTIEDQLIKENSLSNSIPVTINFSQTPGGLSQLSASSSNLDMIPLENIEFIGEDDVRTLVVTPLKGQYGSSIITITLTDTYGRTDSSSFTITVDPLPDSQINVEGCGRVSINNIENDLPWSGRFYSNEDLIQISAIPCNINWIFDHWSGDIYSLSQTISIHSNEFITFKAHFLEKPFYTVNINEESLSDQNNFQIKVNDVSYNLPWSGEFRKDTNIKIEVLTLDEFQSWTGDISSDNNIITLPVSQNLNITAIFYSFNLYLKKGWNLVSIPLVPNTNNILSIISNDFKVYRYIEGIYLEVKHELIPGIGYWIFSPTDKTIKLTGKPYTAYDNRFFPKGWNLIGGLSEQFQFTNIPEGTIGGIYEYKEGNFVEVESLKPGIGYFINVLKPFEF